MLDTGQLPLSGNALLWFRQGLAAAVSEEYPQAVAYFDRVLELRADFYEAWYERGLALEHCGCYADAIASFDQALSLKPRGDVASQIWYDRGNALQYGLGNYSEAIACYDRVLQINSSHELAWQNRGNALLYGLNNPAEAISCYNRTLQINPDNHLAWRNRGNALIELKQYSEALASYDRALSIKPDDEVSWHARNLVSEQSGLNYKQPTTNPAWYGSGYSDATHVEGETDNRDSTSSKSISPDRSGHVSAGYPLLVIEDDWGSREIVLENDQYQIGRDPKSDICLHSQFASRQHAVVTRRSKDDGTYSYQITDGNLDGKPSTNGLLINGQKYRTWDLKPEDVVVFGPSLRAIYRLASTK